MMEHFFTLIMLVLLQAVLGFDNLLYISLESKKAPKDRQGYVRKVGILLAVVLRIALLLLLVKIVGYFQEPIFSVDFPSLISATFNFHSIIVLFGGIFIIYTAIKEIWHMVATDHLVSVDSSDTVQSTSRVIAMIVVMNLVFSFDSILSAMALTDVFWVMSAAIVTGGLLMVWLSDKVADFLEKNRMYEVLGLFILFVVGVMLLTEGGHLAHLFLFEAPVEPMSKTTFYFVITILVLIDLVQSRYQKNILKKKKKY